MDDMSDVKFADLMSVTEAAETLGISTGLVCRYIKQRRLRGGKVGHFWVIDRKSFDLFVKQERKRGRPASENAAALR